MRNKLIQYIDLLFAGTAATQEVADLKEELTRNTLDRFDDLVQQGKSEEAAYNLAVAGIGDINELLQQMKPAEPASQPAPAYAPPYTPPETPKKKKGLPAFARWLITILWVLAALLYLAVSFSTGAWLITWLIFPIAGAASQVIRAAFDLTHRIARFVIFLILLVTLSVAFIGLLPNKENMRFGLSRDYVFKDSSYHVGAATMTQAVSEVDITWINGSVTLKTYSGTQVELLENEGLSAAEQLRWRLENGRLTIYPRRSFWFYGFFNMGNLPEKDLTLLIPADSTLRDIEISSVSAGIDLNGLQAGSINLEQVSGGTTLQKVTGTELELDGTSGALTCTECTFNTLNFTTVSGNANYSGSLAEADVDSVSADIRIESSRPLEEIDGNSVSGDFRITLPEGSGFSVEMDSVSGDLKSDFPLTSSGDSKVYGNADGEYSFDTVSGDVHLIKNS